MRCQLAFVVITAAAIAAACIPKPAAEPVEPVSVEELSQAKARVAELEGEVAAWGGEVAALELRVSELLGRASKDELRLLERDTEIQDLNRRLEFGQLRVDDAISEVVRAKAKLRGSESKAEAASELAEAEISFADLAEVPGGPETPEYEQAAQLIEDSSLEFDAENFGGAIYLASQAKSVISLGQVRLGERAPFETTAGEIPFGVPLPLSLLKNSNIRAGPGLDFRILGTLRQGTPLVGYSYQGEWIHVRLEDGTTGWVYQTLVGGR
jgi:hypothetical protein